MVQPVYLDWSRYSIPGADAIDAALVPPIDPYFGPILDCSTWSYVYVGFDNTLNAQYAQVSIDWLSYAISPSPNPSNFLVVGPNQFATFTLPVIGRTIQMKFNPVVGPFTSNVVYSIVGLSHSMTKYDAKRFATLIIDDTSAYGAGATKTLVGTFWYEGPAQVALFTNNNTPAWAEFQFYDAADQAWHDFAIIGAVSWPNSQQHTINIPPAPFRVFVTNQGAAQIISIHVGPAPQL